MDEHEEIQTVVFWLKARTGLEFICQVDGQRNPYDGSVHVMCAPEHVKALAKMFMYVEDDGI